MVSAVQIGAAPSLSVGSVGAIGTARSNLDSPDERVDAGSNGLGSDSAARPGRPLTRLDLRSQTSAQAAAEEEEPQTPKPDSTEAAESNANGEAVDEQGLTEADRRKIEQLKKRDREVREHERAHATAGGSIAGSPSFTFTRGPDGKQYAVGGEVSIDASPVPGNPQATIRKMEQVKRAALAPRNPSSQDRRVASRADAEIIKAKSELAELKREEQAERSQSSPAQQSLQGDSIGQTDPAFDPLKRFRNSVGTGLPLRTGLAGGGELNTSVGLTEPGKLYSLVA